MGFSWFFRTSPAFLLATNARGRALALPTRYGKPKGAAQRRTGHFSSLFLSHLRICCCRQPQNKPAHRQIGGLCQSLRNSHRASYRLRFHRLNDKSPWSRYGAPFLCALNALACASAYIPLQRSTSRTYRVLELLPRYRGAAVWRALVMNSSAPVQAVNRLLAPELPPAPAQFPSPWPAEKSPAAPAHSHP